MFVCVCINAEMLYCPASDQSGTEIKKTNDAGTEAEIAIKKTHSSCILTITKFRVTHNLSYFTEQIYLSCPVLFLTWIVYC
jgi:hypothetical protein